MKRVFSLIIVISIAIMLACPAYAAEDTFVPSIADKGAPELIVDEDGNVGYICDAEGNLIATVPEECLVITSVADAAESELIPDHAEEMLLSVYAQLLSGEMQLPAQKLDENLEPDEVVIRDLFDISWICEGEDPTHEEMIEPEDVHLVLNFKVRGLKANEILHVMTYKNGEWNPIEDVINNGDGTVTCVFEHLCPVAFAVGEDVDAPSTGYAFDNQVMIWSLTLIASSVALAAILLLRSKKNLK